MKGTIVLLAVLFYYPVHGQTVSGPPQPAAPSSQPATPPQDGAPRDYLSTRLASTHFTVTADGLRDWRQVQKTAFFKALAGLPDSVKRQLTARADKLMNYDWPTLPAAGYMEYKTTGNRSRYEQLLGQRSNALNAFVIAWLISGDNKYRPQAVNGLWATLEQSTWVLPAHVTVQKAGAGLPDPDEQIVDLVDGTTAADIAAIGFLLHDRLEAYAPMINKRIGYELNRRIITPYLARTDFGWMGFRGGKPNNWNPWINSNALSTVLFSEDHTDTVNRVLEKVLRSTDYFINGYGEDGGCDEGPTYWSEAGGNLIKILDIAGSLSGDVLRWKDIPLLHRMGSYIYTMHIAGEYVVNFADATPRTIPDAESVYLFGRYFGDDTLRCFGAYLFDLTKHSLPTGNLNDFFRATLLYGDLTRTARNCPPSFTGPSSTGVSSTGAGISASWLPQVQVMTARARRKGGGDLFLAVQGGNNGESHNHNDVGNFILYAGGKPVIVDAGVGTYTATTFSKDRYTLWNMQSQWHNCPVINGQQQKDGSQYKASDILYNDGKDVLQLSMNVGAAYPPSADVVSWKRTYTLERDGPAVDLDEDYALSQWTAPSTVNFLTSCAVRRPREGELDFVGPDGKTLLTMTYDPVVFDVHDEDKKMDEDRLKSSWGDHLTRVTCVIANKALSGRYRFVFALPKS